MMKRKRLPAVKVKSFLGWSEYFASLEMLDNLVKMAETGHNPQLRADLALRGATEIIQRLHQGAEPQLTKEELDLLVEGSMNVILNANKILGRERIEIPLGSLGDVRHHVSPEPFGNLWWAINALMEFDGDDLLPIRKNLEAAEMQSNFPEWAGNAHLKQAIKISRIALERRIAGAKIDDILPMIRGASMSLKAASLRKASPWRSLAERMEHLKMPIEEAEGAIRPESVVERARGIVGAIKQSMQEASVLNWDESPVSQRIAQADNMIKAARTMAADGYWVDATKNLFGASLLAQIAKESPLSEDEARQAGQVLEAIPEEKEALKSYFKAWATHESMRRVQREISPLPGGLDLPTFE